MRLFLVAAMLLFTVAGAVAQNEGFSDGESLRKFTGLVTQWSNKEQISTADGKVISFGIFYLAGFREGGEMTISLGHSLPYIWDEHTSAAQVALLVEKYFQEHPSSLRDKPGEVICRVLTEAFPNPAFSR